MGCYGRGSREGLEGPETLKIVKGDPPWQPLSKSPDRLVHQQPSWLLLALPGSSWLLLAPPGSSWLLVAPPGSSWLLVAPPDSSWLTLAPPASSWLLPGSS